MKRTPWFDATEQKPVRVGHYEFYDPYANRIDLVYWDGLYWPWQSRYDIRIYKGDKWRGLTKETK
jgi:hypothetical protein